MSTIKYAYLVTASLLAVVGWTSNAPIAAQTAPTDPLTAKAGDQNQGQIRSGTYQGFKYQKTCSQTQSHRGSKN